MPCESNPLAQCFSLSDLIIFDSSTTGNGCGDAFVKADAGVDGDEPADAACGLNFCMGRTTDCTTWGLLVLVASGVTGMASSAGT